MLFLRMGYKTASLNKYLLNTKRMENKTIVVSAGIIRKDGKILIAKRKADDRYEPGKWEFSGGKVEFSEDPKDCVVREVKEELNISITVDKLFSVYSSVTEKENIHVILMVYLTDWIDGEVKRIECDDTLLIHYEELSKYDFTAADKPIVEDIINYCASNFDQKKVI
jgi:8-oxo-dGTP diphosphatase